MEVFTQIMAHKVDNSTGFKYHAGFKELKLTHFCFADDLLVMCHGNVDSVKIIKESLDKFSNVSGLKPNISKSTIFFGNVKMEDQRKILNVMPFTVGKFPVKYLGVPLITKRLSREECKKLLDKVKNKVDDWKNKFLSYARSGDLARGKAKIAWKTLCKPKCQGGLGFKNLGRWNEVLLTKLIWNIAANKKSLWVKWVHVVKLGGKSFWAIEAKNNDSWIHSFVLWMAIQERLQTQDRIFLWNKDANMRCHLCDKSMDSHDHLFVQCCYAIEVWDVVKMKGYINGLKQNWKDTIESMAANHYKAIKSVVSWIVFRAVIYYLWQERNKRYISNEKKSTRVLSEVILETAKTRLMGIKVKNSTNVLNVAKD
ncbi:RNA-directed DNA polymerase, eukaryota, reverse transcriptase zinc-binding domain protein [Tanacetum coccineum]